MTIPEIQALKAELEAALLQAFSDFQTRTGLVVESVNVEHIESWRMDQPKPEKRVTFISVRLESL